MPNNKIVNKKIVGTELKNSEHTFFFAKTISELLYQLKSVAGLTVMGALTHPESSAERIISIRGISELANIAKHERYIDFGPGVTLSEIVSLERSKIPSVLTEAAESIANPAIRNLATLGGNICASGKRQSLYAALLALDTRLELRSNSETNFIPLRNFTTIPEGFILTNIRVPLENWDISLFFRLGHPSKLTETSATFAFLVDTEKDTINNIRIAFASHVAFRINDLETKLIGSRLPLLEKDFSEYLELAEKKFESQSEGIIYNTILQTQFLNVLRYSLEQLT